MFHQPVTSRFHCFSYKKCRCFGKETSKENNGPARAILCRFREMRQQQHLFIEIFLSLSLMLPSFCVSHGCGIFHNRDNMAVTL
jgi:hypothetical protein